MQLIPPPLGSRRIWLIRHAQSEGNRDNIIQGHFDTPLTDFGHGQARALAEWFATSTVQERWPVHSIHASDLHRAWQTAEAVGRRLQMLPVTRHFELREANFGHWEGRSASELRNEDPSNYERWKAEKRWRPHWCENFWTLQQRGLGALNHLLRSYPGNLVVVSHGGLIYGLVAHWANHLVTRIYNCGVTELTFRPDGSVSIEQVSFLPPGVEVSPEMRPGSLSEFYR